MKLKDVVKHAAVYLGLIKAVGYLENGEYAEDGDAMSAVDTLTRCANLVLSELACAYVAMVKSENITLDGDKVYYSTLSDAPRRILCVSDANGNAVHYEVMAEYFKVGKGASIVKYEYFPPVYDLNDNVGYEERDIPSRIIAYGVAAEYSLTARAFEESLMWRDRYEKGIKQAVPKKSVTLKGREFI